jgi:hypothetical protein
MATIQLDRRFAPWANESHEEIDAARILGQHRGSLRWPDLLALKRVVVLAEGGSGKTSEFREQSRLLATAGKFSFYVTVKKVGQKGFEQSLTQPQAERFKQWRASDQPAWFFVDSVDEAKSGGVSLVDALEHLAAAIQGAELRAHVIMSGRHTDWEFRKDLQSLVELIPVPSAQEPNEPVDPDKHIIDAVRRRPREQPKAKEEHLIALMSELDFGQVQIYARESQIESVQKFLDGLSEAKLWSFARRPLDLDWLVRYWRAHGSFGKFAAMLDLNISERLTEPDPDRAKSIQLDQALGMKALERIGAALVLGKQRDIEIPDSGNRADPQPALRLREALPDISLSLQSNLMNSAVFVPSGVGMVRLHNDNDGVVSSHLAAKWLKRMLEENCPWSVVDALLFATTYGVRVTKPSMVQTAAWLSLWDARAAEELTSIQPMALVELGDAASLPLPIRKKVLKSVVEAFATGNERHLINHDGLKRFAQRDMEPDVNELFARFGTDAEARQVLLQMVDHGRLLGCSSIAIQVATDSQADSLSQSLAVQALATAGSENQIAAYVDFLRAHRGEVDIDVIWTAFDSLFPQALTSDDLLAALPRLLAETLQGSTGIDYYGPHWAAKIQRESDTEKLLADLFSTLPPEIAKLEHAEIDHLSERFSTIMALANRLLDLHSGDTPPDLAIDASLRLDSIEWRRGRREKEGENLAARLRETPSRRRATLWRLASTFALMEHSIEGPLNDPWQLNAARFQHGLGIGDADWLLEDARSRADENDRLLALRLAMLMWRESDKPEWLLGKAKEVAGQSAELNAAIDGWVNPPPPPEQLQRMLEANKQHEQEHLERQRKDDASWVTFVQDIRSNPGQLESLRAPDDEGVDWRIFHIWQVLDGLGGNSQRRSLSDVGLLTPSFGAATIPFIRNAFIQYWRLGKPRLRSERPVELVNTDTAMERLGIVGISIEAATNPNWISGLSDTQAELAAIYATLELNGFPTWFDDLCMRRPAPVHNILRRYVARDLAETSAPGYREALERITRAHDAIVAVMAPDMIGFLTDTAGANVELLGSVLRIARNGLADKATLLALSLERAEKASAVTEISAYLACAFAIDGDAATSMLFALAKNWDAQKTTDLASILLPSIMGTSWFAEDSKSPRMSTENLARLIPFAFKSVSPKDDIDRANGKVYSPGTRDHAQDARNITISRLAERPGAATFKALNELAEIEDFYIPKWRMQQLALNRAALDSESEPWTPSDVKGFEGDFDTVPRNPADLQRVAANRIDDLQHKLIHGDYSQGVEVVRLAHEVDVQRWVANALEARQGRSYTVVREPHVAQEKEPDILLTSRGSSAHLPLEIKVAESWTLKQLEEALSVQLKDRYLRDRNARWGILLVVHQAARVQGWQDTATGEFLAFSQVIKRLQSWAQTISASDSNGPQLQICVIDVSSVKR